MKGTSWDISIIYKCDFLNLCLVPNLNNKSPAEIISNAVTNVRGDTIDFKIPGAVEINWQSDSLLIQFFCIGKIRTMETSIIIIIVPMRENIAPHFMI